MEDKKRLTIHFMDGSEMNINFKPQHHDSATIAAAIEKAAESNKLVIEIEGILYVYPYSNIKYLRVSPSPEILPETAIKGAQIEDH